MNDDISDLLNYPANERSSIDIESLLTVTAPDSGSQLYQASKLQVVLSSNRILKIFVDLLSPHISNLIYAVQSKANYFEWDGKAVMSKIMSLYSDRSGTHLAQESESGNRLLTNTIKNYILKKSKKIELEVRNARITKRVIRNELFCNNGSFDGTNSSADYLYLNYLLSRVALVDEAIAFSDVSEELINSHKVYDRKCHSLRRSVTDLCESLDRELKALGMLQAEEIARMNSDFLDITTDSERYPHDECVVSSHKEVVRVVTAAAAGVSAILAAKERLGNDIIGQYYKRTIDAEIERLRVVHGSPGKAPKPFSPAAESTPDPVGDETRAAMQAALQENLVHFQRFLCDILKRSSKVAIQFVEDKYTETALSV